MKTFVYPIESILQVHDGDTLTARYKTRPDTTVQETIRLKGVDTHELHGEKLPIRLRKRKSIQRSGSTTTTI